MSNREAISVKPLATAKCSRSYGVSIKIVLLLRDVLEGKRGDSLRESLQFPFLLYCDVSGWRIKNKE